MKKGFTLIELMIVVVIIGILAAIAIPKFSDVADSAKESSCRANMNTLSTQEAMWMAVHSDYTSSLTDLGFTGLDCPSTPGSDYVLTSTPDGANIAYTVTCGDSANTGHGAIINGLPNW